MKDRKSGDTGRIIVRRQTRRSGPVFYALTVEAAIAWIVKARRQRGTRDSHPCRCNHWIERSGYAATLPHLSQRNCYTSP